MSVYAPYRELSSYLIVQIPALSKYNTINSIIVCADFSPNISLKFGKITAAFERGGQRVA